MAAFLRSLQEFQRSFPDNDACAAYLAKRRWPNGFVCPVCGHGKGWRLTTKPWTYECAGCRQQTSLTANTVMHGSKLPLTTWFYAAHLIATHGDELSIRQLQHLLDLGKYRPAWRLYHRLSGVLPQNSDAAIAEAFKPEAGDVPRRVDHAKAAQRAQHPRRRQRRPNPQTPPATASELEAMKREHSQNIIDAVARSSSLEDAVAKVNEIGRRASFCPACGRTEIKPIGFYHGVARFWCQGCGRSFSPVTGTPLERLRRSKTWWAYSKLLKGELNREDAAEQSGVAINTLRRLEGSGDKDSHGR